MNLVRRAASRALIASVALVAMALPLATRAAPPDYTPDGLQRIAVKGMDDVYVRPGASLARYRKVMLDPVVVSFDSNWHPNRDELDPADYVTDQDKARIKKNLAALVRDEFSRDIARDGGYAVVDAPGPDVLRITAEIVDLYVNAPDVMTPDRVTQYVTSAGRMTLAVELRDSMTGELIARAVDRKVDPDYGWLRRADGVTNSAAARRAVDAWTSVLRKRLDAARAGLVASTTTATATAAR